MKRSVLLPLLSLSLAANAQTTLLEENFDSYAEGSGMASNDPAHWTPWPGASDQVISTAYALSGTNSLACISTDAGNGGPGDLLLLLGDKTTGIYDLGWSMLVPADKGGYFNLQHAEDVGTNGSYGLEVLFAGGVITAVAAGDTSTDEYVPGEWVEILINVDVDNSGAALFVNGTAITTWPLEMDTEGNTVTPQLGAIDFYSYGDGTTLGEYYIDDVSYVQTSAGGIGMAENAATVVRVFPNPAQEVVNVTLAGPLSQQASVRLVDVSGRQVATPVITSPRSLRFQVEGLGRGIYFVRIDDGGRSAVERIVKD